MDIITVHILWRVPHGVVYALVYYGIPRVGVCTRNVPQQDTAYGWDARLLKTCGEVMPLQHFSWLSNVVHYASVQLISS